MNLELRMYGLVPYNISPIQQSIQFGHAVVEYGLEFFDDEDYQNWAKIYKTFIILNGGTSNHTQNRYTPTGNTFRETDSLSHIGTMEKNYRELLSKDFKCAAFYEPDLNDMLSAIVFLVDERVFDKEKYPDFRPVIQDPASKKAKFYRDNKFSLSYTQEPTFWDNGDKVDYLNWIESIGGKKNFFLREFLKNFRLA